MQFFTKHKLAAAFAVVAGIVGYNVLENINDSKIKAAQDGCTTTAECRQAIAETGNATRDLFVMGMVGALVLGAGLDRLAGRRRDSDPPAPNVG